MEERNLKSAIVEATVNAFSIFALSLGMLILGKQSGQLAADISLHYIVLQASAVGMIRFASYMYSNREDVSPGKAIERLAPIGDGTGKTNVHRFFRRHEVCKLI